MVRQLLLQLLKEHQLLLVGEFGGTPVAVVPATTTTPEPRGAGGAPALAAATPAPAPGDAPVSCNPFADLSVSNKAGSFQFKPAAPVPPKTPVATTFVFGEATKTQNPTTPGVPPTPANPQPVATPVPRVAACQEAASVPHLKAMKATSLIKSARSQFTFGQQAANAAVASGKPRNKKTT